MKQSRQESLLGGMNGTANKVYNVVPIKEAWTTRQVVSELIRLGTPYNKEVVMGCLRALCESGLVMHIGDTFQRVPITPRAARTTEHTTTPKEPPAMPNPNPAPTSAPDALTALGSIAAGLRKHATNLEGCAVEARTLADRLEHAALETQQQIEENAEAARRLRGLADLLKPLT